MNWFVSTVTFRVPEWGNVTVIEAGWTLIGLIGVIVTTLALLRIKGDGLALALEPDGHPERRRAAELVWRSHLRREALRMVQNLMIVGVGVWSMTQAPVVRPAVATVTTLIITGTFMVMVGITVIQSVQDGRARREITDILSVNGNGHSEGG
jgi:hypothetical protein